MQTHKFFFSSLQHLPHKNKKTPNEVFYGGCIHLNNDFFGVLYGCNPCYNGGCIHLIQLHILFLLVVILVIMEGAYTWCLKSV